MYEFYNDKFYGVLLEIYNKASDINKIKTSILNGITRDENNNYPNFRHTYGHRICLDLENLTPN